TRFIPADAGNGCAPARQHSNDAVYPRGCGERCRAHLAGSTHRGLSPRMRGTGSFQRIETINSRFIPADAGNGDRTIRTVRSYAVYPRGCGERVFGVSFLITKDGLSPRMRGTADRRADCY